MSDETHLLIPWPAPCKDNVRTLHRYDPSADLHSAVRRPATAYRIHDIAAGRDMPRMLAVLERLADLRQVSEISH
jgi:hypothetical protein